MSALTLALLLSLAAGLSMAAGALIGVKQHIARGWLEQEVRHTVIAFGGGALLAAVALVLVPEGAQHHTPLSATLLFVGGGIAFMVVDRALAATHRQCCPQGDGFRNKVQQHGQQLWCACGSRRQVGSDSVRE